MGHLGHRLAALFVNTTGLLINIIWPLVKVTLYLTQPLAATGMFSYYVDYTGINWCKHKSYEMLFKEVLRSTSKVDVTPPLQSFVCCKLLYVL